MSRNSFATPLAAIDGVVLDTETTGLDARTARIVQIGAVRIRGGEVHDSEPLDLLVDPGIPIPPETIAVHGITDARVAGAPAFPEAAAALQRYIDGAIVIGHTIGYDLAVLAGEARRTGLTWTPPRVLDVRVLAELAKPALAQYDLDRIAAALGVPVEGRHTAIGDALTTARIYAGLLQPLRERGIRTLADVDAATRTLSERQLAAGQRAGVSLPAAADRVTVLQRIDSFPYRHVVADVMSQPVVRCGPGDSVRQALGILVARKVSSVLVDDAAGVTGLATERDMIRVIERFGAPALDMAVSEAATRPLQTVPEDTFVYRAIGRMDRVGIRHLPVTDAAGAISGMVTTRNLLRHRATTAIALGDAIDAAGSVADLGKAWGMLPLVARSLMDEAVDPRTIASVVSTEICAMTRRAAELAEAAMLDAGRGAPPVPYAVLVLGSAGRGESLLAADQDNAIVFAEGEPGGPHDLWFESLGQHMTRILDEVGIPLCKGGVMARNAAWRQSVAGWQATAERWVRRQRPEDLLNVDIFFDAVAVHGDAALGERVLAHAYALAGQARDFQKQIAEVARRQTSPFGLFGGLKGDANGRLDLKKVGLLPVFTAARALAIRLGLRARSSPERLRAAAGAGAVPESDVEALLEAHRTIMGVMIEQQLIDGEAGAALTPNVDLKRLDKEAKAALKEALGSIELAGAMIGEGRL